MNRILEFVNNWGKDKFLEFNAKKTQIIRFGDKNYNQLPLIKINNNTIISFHYADLQLHNLHPYYPTPTCTNCGLFFTTLLVVLTKKDAYAALNMNVIRISVIGNRIVLSVL